MRYYWSYDVGRYSHAVPDDGQVHTVSICGIAWGKFWRRWDHGERHCKRCEKIIAKRLREETGLEEHERPGPVDCMAEACPWPPADCPFSACPRRPPRNRQILKR